jgi:sec-independent protein translocase protein TatA
MLGLSFLEIAAILAVVLIVFGPSKLPERARNLGKGLREFRKATEDFRSGITNEMHRPETPRPAAPLESGAASAALPAKESEAELVDSTRPAPGAIAQNAEPTSSAATAPASSSEETKVGG